MAFLFYLKKIRAESQTQSREQERPPEENGRRFARKDFLLSFPLLTG